MLFIFKNYVKPLPLLLIFVPVSLFHVNYWWLGLYRHTLYFFLKDHSLRWTYFSSGYAYVLSGGNLSRIWISKCKECALISTWFSFSASLILMSFLLLFIFKNYLKPLPLLLILVYVMLNFFKLVCGSLFNRFLTDSPF